jgi:hypothetical protein
VAAKVSVLPLRLNLALSAPPVIAKLTSLLLTVSTTTRRSSDLSDVAYRVKVQAIRTVRFGVLTSIITAEKTITVTVTDLDDEAPTNIQIFVPALRKANFIPI